jgi:DNA-binding NarL/FixJ family response regulator
MRVEIAEDSALLRDGLVHVVERRGHVVAAAVGDAGSLLAAVASDPPDAAIIDVRMPPSHTDEGLQAALTLRRTNPGVAVLMLSQYVETHYAALLLAGPIERLGYLLKDRVTEVAQFLDALERVAAGGTVLDPEVVSQIIGASQRSDILRTLTARERDVLALMAEGRSNTSIAGALHLSTASIEKHITALFTKLNLPPSTTTHRRVLAVLRYLES